MKQWLAAAAIAAVVLAPATALACGDSMAYANPEQLGLQSAPQATPVPATTVAKNALPKAAKPASRDVKQAQAMQDKVKVAVLH